MKLHRLTNQLLLILLVAGLSAFLTSNARAMSLPPRKTKPPQTPVRMPIDLTKAGNKLEFEFEVKERGYYWIELLYYYDDPRESKYMFIEFIKSFMPAKEYTREELDEILKDDHRVRKLVGHNELKDGKRIFYPPIPTPLKIKISALDKGSEKVIFEDVKDYAGEARVGARYTRPLIGIPLSPDLYKAEIETLKNAPELIGTRIEFRIAKEYIK